MAAHHELVPNKREAEISECMEIFRKLSPEGKKAAIAIAKWLLDDGRPETDPRNDDPYWQASPRRRSG